MTTFMLRICILFAALICVTGCASRDVLTPSVPQGHNKMEIVPGDGEMQLPTPSASVFLNPPPNTSPAAVGSVPLSTFGDVPDSTWVVLYVDGSIEAQRNPACTDTPPAWPCQTGPVVGNWDAVPGTGGPVRLWANEMNPATWDRSTFGDATGRVQLQRSGCTISLRVPRSPGTWRQTPCGRGTRMLGTGHSHIFSRADTTLASCPFPARSGFPIQGRWIRWARVSSLSGHSTAWSS